MPLIHKTFIVFGAVYIEYWMLQKFGGSNEVGYFGFSQNIFVEDGEFIFASLQVPPETIDPEVTRPEDKIWYALADPVTLPRLWEELFKRPVAPLVGAVSMVLLMLSPPTLWHGRASDSARTNRAIPHGPDSGWSVARWLDGQGGDLAITDDHSRSQVR